MIKEGQAVLNGVSQSGSLLQEFDRMYRMTEGRYHVADLVVNSWWQERNKEIGWEHNYTRTARRLVKSAFPLES